MELEERDGEELEAVMKREDSTDVEEITASEFDGKAEAVQQEPVGLDAAGGRLFAEAPLGALEEVAVAGEAASPTDDQRALFRGVMDWMEDGPRGDPADQVLMGEYPELFDEYLAACVYGGVVP
jgi:hypothetical protein